MHPLTENIHNAEPSLILPKMVVVDQIITDWLKEKAEEIDKYHSAPDSYCERTKTIENILDLSEPTLVEKFKDVLPYKALGLPEAKIQQLAKIAEEHKK